MKIKRKMVAGFVAIMMCFLLVACGNKEKDASERMSEDVTEDVTAKPYTEQNN